MHLSCADTIPLIAEAKKSSIPLTVETCPHYLTLAAEDVPARATQFKCCPPIRGKDNQVVALLDLIRLDPCQFRYFFVRAQEKLWAAVMDGTIDLIVSDHSPAPKDLKCTETGDFMRAWGGIASLQLGITFADGSKWSDVSAIGNDLLISCAVLPLTWTHGHRRGMSLNDLSRLLSQNTAALAGLGNRKGSIAVMQDADLLIWDPEAEFQVS